MQQRTEPTKNKRRSRKIYAKWCGEQQDKVKQDHKYTLSNAKKQTKR